MIRRCIIPAIPAARTVAMLTIAAAMSVACVSCSWPYGSGVWTPDEYVIQCGGDGMCLVPAGTFQMGCNEDLDQECGLPEKEAYYGEYLDNDKPYHEVWLSAFYIGRTEVTQAQYAKCVSARKCSYDDRWIDGDRRGADRPMIVVGQEYAAEYCAWTGQRLPTEAEWEKAARGTDGRKYPWGNETATCDRAVMCDGLDFETGTGCGTKGAMNVCSHSPAGDSPYGLCDMAGNAAEWVSDYFSYDYYSESPYFNPEGPSLAEVSSGYTSTHLARGGNWGSGTRDVRAAYRGSINTPTWKNGFRCALSAQAVDDGCVTSRTCVEDSECGADELCNTARPLAVCQKKWCGISGSACSDPQLCFGDSCTNRMCDATLECVVRECGLNLEDADPESYCGQCGALFQCSDAGTCLPTNDCQEDCGTFECGSNSYCGGSCGECAAGYACIDGSCENPVIVDGMVTIPAGPFHMGAETVYDGMAEADEFPFHEVTLSAYLIDVTEVTLGAYRACVEASVCGEPDTTPGGCNWNTDADETQPVTCVTLDDARDYCTWSGKRLPTEAEWEKAARGDASAGAPRHPWGNEMATCELAVFQNVDSGTGHSGTGCGTDGPLPVCSKSPAGDSPWLLCDMAGNVAEWVQDAYDPDYYRNGPSTDPQGPLTSNLYGLLRGGGIYSARNELRVSDRDYRTDDASYTSGDIGFRCAKSE